MKFKDSKRYLDVKNEIFQSIKSDLIQNTAPIRENFLDGKNPEDKGDMARHGLKGKTIVQLKKVRSSDSATPREKQLAHWRINMVQGKNKKDK